MKTINQAGSPQKFGWSPQSIQVFTLVTLWMVGLSLDVFIIALTQIREAFQVSQFQVSLVVSLWSAGLCSGLFCFGPLMDAVGRKKVFLGGMILVAVTSFLCLVVKDFNLILFFRFCHGFGVAAQKLTARAVIIDIFTDRKQQAQGFTWTIIFTFISGFISPLFGGFLLTNFGWKSLFLFLGIAGTTVALLIMLGFPETLPVEKRQKFALIAQLKGYFVLVCDKVYFGYCLIGSLSLFWVFAYFVTAPYLFRNVFAFTTFQLSLFMSSSMFWAIFAALLNRYLLHFYSVDTLLKWCERVFLLHVTILLAVALLGIKSAPVYIVNLYFGKMTIAFLSSNSLAAAVVYRRDRAGTAAALFGILQFGSGFIASALMGYLLATFIRLGYPLSTLPMPLFFFAVGMAVMLVRFTLLRNR